MTTNNKSINLLWTGGLDSSFRLLELLLIQKKSVQPYYVYDRRRSSMSMELKAMEKIRELIFEKDQNCEKLLMPTIFKELSEIKPNTSITQTYQRVYSDYSIGIQNEWLARFAEETNITDLELSIEARVNVTHPFNGVVLANLDTEKDGDYYNYKLQNNPSYPDLSLFKNFRFPLIKRTKTQMLKIAKEHDFMDILQHSWFCHSPVNQKPCGICKPCTIAIGEGLWKRIPVYGLFRYIKVHTIRPLIYKDLQSGKKEFTLPLKRILRMN